MKSSSSRKSARLARWRTSQRQMEIMASPPVVYVVVTQSSNQARGIWRISPTLSIAPAPPCMEKVCVGVLGMPHLPLAPLNSAPADAQMLEVPHTGNILLLKNGYDMPRVLLSAHHHCMYSILPLACRAVEFFSC